MCAISMPSASVVFLKAKLFLDNGIMNKSIGVYINKHELISI